MTKPLTTTDPSTPAALRTTIDPSILNDPFLMDDTLYMTDTFFMSDSFIVPEPPTETEPLITLREALTQQKRQIPCAALPKKQTLYTGWPAVEEVSIWTDFNVNNLNSSFGHVLDGPISQELLPLLQPKDLSSDVVINKTEDVLDLISWGDSLMQPTLWLAKEYLGL